MSIFQVPDKSDLSNCEFFQIPMECGILTSYQYSGSSNTLYAKDSQIVIPTMHGLTHVTTDPVPQATCDSQGLMSADDKCKLDVLTQTRLGVLGFQGAGFPDDGGWMQGDIILAAGNEMINLERIGNVVRFTVENAINLCACEECAQIYWIKDETESRAIRPPSCNGTLPDVNVYGELKIYQLPKTAILDTDNPKELLDTKGNYPSLIFKRYDDAMTPYEAEFDMVLKRRSDLTTLVGWAMTPGPLGVPECVWFCGEDDDNNVIRFELHRESDPGLLGMLLYQGHSLTRRMAVITNYTTGILSNNQYKVKFWDIQNATIVGDEFTATNIWKYNNPENLDTDPDNPKTLELDATKDVLSIGTLVQLWEFQTGEINGVRQVRYYFNLEPDLNPAHLWTTTGTIRFGDLLDEREELTQTPGGQSELTAHLQDVSDIRLFERSIWGITGFEDRLILSDDGAGGWPSGSPINNLFVADIDYELPGLKIIETNPIGPEGTPGAGTELTVADNINERPIWLWHRSNHRNLLFRALIGMPTESDFPPYDILLRAPVDSFDDTYLKIFRRGVIGNGPFAGLHYVLAKGMRWKDLPAYGFLRILTGTLRNDIWRYEFKAAFPTDDDNGIMLIGTTQFPFEGDSGTGTGTDPDVPTSTTVAELTHADFSTPCVRMEFSVNNTSGSQSVQLQVKVGILDMSLPYELNISADPKDDLVRGLRPGYTVSDTFTQMGFISDGIGSGVESNPPEFRVYEGGELPAPVSGETEKWNELIVMYRDLQCWVWWNNYLVTPDPTASAALDTPVAVNTPYFPLSPLTEVGKAAMRMWPGCSVRDVTVMDQATQWSELSRGQLELV